MRALAFTALLILGLSCTTTKEATSEPGALDGTWVPVRQELGGKALPEAVYRTQKLVLSDTTYTLTAGRVDRGVVRYRDGRMDIYGKEGVNTGRHFTAIYRHESGQLTVCYNLSGDSYPVAFDTRATPALFLSVFKKAATAGD